MWQFWLKPSQQFRSLFENTAAATVAAAAAASSSSLVHSFPEHFLTSSPFFIPFDDDDSSSHSCFFFSDVHDKKSFGPVFSWFWLPPSSLYLVPVHKNVLLLHLTDQLMLRLAMEKFALNINYFFLKPYVIPRRSPHNLNNILFFSPIHRMCVRLSLFDMPFQRRVNFPFPSIFIFFEYESIKYPGDSC